MTQKTSAPPAARSEASGGILYGLGAYGMWGLLPLYFVLVAAASALEIVAARILWSLVFCAVLMTFMRSWSQLGPLLRDRAAMAKLTVAAFLIAVNWLVYAYAVISGQTVEAALGYFINPLVSAAIGVVVLKEKLSRLQWVAMGTGLVAVVVLTVAYGALPYIALTLALTFGVYGYLKNRVGPQATAVTGLTVETAVLALPSAAAMAWLATQGQATFLDHGAAHFWLLAAGGIITAMPLILFSAAARRLPLSTVGMLQYLAPTMQFIIAVAVFHEQMPPERWVGFGLVWVAIAILTADALRGARPGVRR